MCFNIHKTPYPRRESLPAGIIQGTLNHEKNISAFKQAEEPGARLPKTHVNRRRQKYPEEKAPERAGQACGLGLNPPLEPEGLHKFPREERLKKDELRRVIFQGSKTVRGGLRLYVMHVEGAGRKAAFVVRGCRGSAVERNRLKRLFREVYRLNKHSLKKDIRLVFILEKPDRRLEYSDIEKEFLAICRQAGVTV